MATEEELLHAPIGPGTIEPATADYIPALDGATRDEIVEILNPLDRDFIARVGVTRNAHMPVRITPNVSGEEFREADLSRAGITGFRNKDLGGGRVHVSNTVRIPAHGRIRQPGDVAQIIVKQLVTAIIQMRDEKLKIADPATRKAVENEVIISRRSMSELFGAAGPMTVDEQIEAKVREANDEAAFPDANLSPEPEGQDAAKAKATGKAK